MTVEKEINLIIDDLLEVVQIHNRLKKHDILHTVDIVKPTITINVQLSSIKKSDQLTTQF